MGSLGLVIAGYPLGWGRTGEETKKTHQTDIRRCAAEWVWWACPRTEDISLGAETLGLDQADPRCQALATGRRQAPPRRILPLSVVFTGRRQAPPRRILPVSAVFTAAVSAFAQNNI